MELTFRPAGLSDLERITDIYNQAILNGNCTADTEPFRPEQRLEWFQAHCNDQYPLFVCELAGEIAGYGYFTAYRPGRRAVAHVAEVSYYLDFSMRGRGIGTAFLQFLIEQAKPRGITVLLAILLASNAASVRLLEKCGFQLWGRLPGVVRLGGRRIDHVYYGRHLETAPA